MMNGRTESRAHSHNRRFSNQSHNQSRLFADYLWLTQLQQARCYETAFAQWRRQRSQPTQTMGILYWQLNDIWPAPSWSTIEFDGTPKLSHHAVARAFAPLLLSTTEAAGTVSVHLTSDHSAPLAGTLLIELHRWAQPAPARAAATRSAKVVAPALGSASVFTVEMAPLLAAAKAAPTTAFLRLVFRSNVSSAPIQGEACHWLTPMKEAILPPAVPVVVATTILDAGRAQVRLRSDRTAAFVSVASLNISGAFSDGAFLLLAGAEKNLTFVARTPLADHASWDGFRAGLRVRSLRDTYD